jgi:hypothetical protein
MNVMDSSPRAKIPSSEEAVAAPAPQGVRRRSTAGGRLGASDARAGREGRAQEGDDKQRLTPYAALAILAILLVCAAQAAEFGAGAVRTLDDQQVFEFADSPLGRYLRLAGTLCFAGAAAARAVMSRRGNPPGAVLFWLAVLGGTSGLWLLAVTGQGYSWLVTDSLSPVVFGMCLGVLLGSDDSLWPRLRRLAPIIAYGFGLLGLYEIWKEPWAGAVTGVELPPTVFLQTTFWFGAFSLFQLPADRIRAQLISCLPIALVAFEAVYVQNRSWICQCILAIGARFLLLNRAGGINRMWKYAVAAMAALMLSAVVLFLAAAVFPEELSGLRQRLMEDTRTAQYMDFFQQVPLSSFILGAGPLATYATGDSFNFLYIDNQLLLILWKFGVLAMMGYFILVLWPGLKLMASGEAEEDQASATVTSLWLLASLGLSIYHGIVQNPQNFLMILIAGRCYAILEDRRTRSA